MRRRRIGKNIEYAGKIIHKNRASLIRFYKRVFNSTVTDIVTVKRASKGSDGIYKVWVKMKKK